MMEMVDAIRDCAKGAAIATRTEVEERQVDEVVKDVRNDKKLVQYVRKNMDFIGEEYIERDLTQGIGSTDVGNVTHEIPAIQFYVKLKEHVGTHTKEFAVAAGGEEGKRKTENQNRKEDGRDRCRHRGDFEETGGGDPHKTERVRSKN